MSALVHTFFKHFVGLSEPSESNLSFLFEFWLEWTIFWATISMKMLSAYKRFFLGWWTSNIYRWNFEPEQSMAFEYISFWVQIPIRDKKLFWRWDKLGSVLCTCSMQTKCWNIFFQAGEPKQHKLAFLWGSLHLFILLQAIGRSKGSQFSHPSSFQK